MISLPERVELTIISQKGAKQTVDRRINPRYKRPLTLFVFAFSRVILLILLRVHQLKGNAAEHRNNEEQHKGQRRGIAHLIVLKGGCI